MYCLFGVFKLMVHTNNILRSTKNCIIPSHKLAIPLSVLSVIFASMPLFSYHHSLGDTNVGVSNEEVFSSNPY